ncbi:hypothetical protein TNCV_949571 [Trichonephila clavipes]|nr:hypothetical protein TNCV_949571 [Trichonephila clavipes]
MTASRKRNLWFHDGNTERNAGSQQPLIFDSREERHVTHMAVRDLLAMSRALSQELGHHCHTSSSHGEMVCSAIGYTSLSPHVTTLNSHVKFLVYYDPWF